LLQQFYVVHLQGVFFLGALLAIGVNPGADGVVATTPDFRVEWSWGGRGVVVVGREILIYPNYIL